MKDNFIDYRGNTSGAPRDVRTRLKNARAGHTFNFICNEDQIFRLLREITYHDGMIVNKDTTDEGVLLTIRKT